jgi:hypothetical protein
VNLPSGPCRSDTSNNAHNSEVSPARRILSARISWRRSPGVKCYASHGAANEDTDIGRGYSHDVFLEGWEVRVGDLRDSGGVKNSIEAGEGGGWDEEMAGRQ